MVVSNGTRDFTSKQIVCRGTSGPHRPWKRTLKDSIQPNRPRCNNARCATLATTRRQIVCTLWYIVCGRAFKTVSHELRFASSTKTIAREPWLVGSQYLVCSKHSYTYIKLSFFKNKMFNGTVSLKCRIFNRNNFRMM